MFRCWAHCSLQMDARPSLVAQTASLDLFDCANDLFVAALPWTADTSDRTGSSELHNCRTRLGQRSPQRLAGLPPPRKLNLALARFIYGWEQPTIAVNLIATRVPNRAIRPYLPRSSSALVMRRQSPANLSRQMATGFGFDGYSVGTVVGIRSLRV